MIVSLNREALCDAMNHLSRAVSAKTSIPVLEGILFTAAGGSLTLTGYNLELGMQKTLDARVEEEGAVVLPARVFGDLIRRMKGDQIRLETDDRQMCSLTCGTAKFDLMGMLSSDFPEMPTMPEDKAVTLPGDLLKNIVRRTIFAVAPAEGNRPILTGANFVIENRRLSMVAVDGYRLALRREPVECDENLNFVVSGKAIGEAVRLISEENEPVTMKVGPRHVGFEINGYQLISRLLDGEFIDYKRTIPAGYKQSVRLSTLQVIEILEGISPIINDSFSTPVRCTFSDHQILFSCATAVGRGTVPYDVKVEGPAFEIGINSRYLLEALRAAEVDEITVHFNDGTGPVVIQSEEDDSFLYMVMPMRLR